MTGSKPLGLLTRHKTNGGQRFRGLMGQAAGENETAPGGHSGFAAPGRRCFATEAGALPSNAGVPPCRLSTWGVPMAARSAYFQAMDATGMERKPPGWPVAVEINPTSRIFAAYSLVLLPTKITMKWVAPDTSRPIEFYKYDH
jgi:hypothetical protein